MCINPAYKNFGSPAQVVMNEIQCTDIQGTERDSSLPLQDYQNFIFEEEATMQSKLIELEDGTLVEVEVAGNEVQEISGGIADKVSATFDKIKPILINTCNPIISAWKELNKEMNVESAEVELGLSFEGEGNLYITKSKAAANVKVKLILKPLESENAS